MRENGFSTALRRLCRCGRSIALNLAAAAALAAAMLPLALPAAAAEPPPQKALLRIHLTSYANIQVFNEVDWDVLISTTGQVQGYTTCGCEECEGLWITVAKTAQLSPSQLSTLQAALANNAIGVQPSCSYLDGLLPGDSGTYQLQWYGHTTRENIITMSLGLAVTPPACSAQELDLFKTIDDLVINVLGFPPTLAPETVTSGGNACGAIQGN